jgi:iron only hydrogenase large subunit-like protein
MSTIRKAQDNPSLKYLYEKWLEKPNSEEAEKALHTSYRSRRRISQEFIRIQEAKESKD